MRRVLVLGVLFAWGCSDENEPPTLLTGSDPTPASPAAPGDMGADLDMDLDADLASPANPAGPWPLSDLTEYALGPLRDANPDDAQNLWAISDDALYLLRPGQVAFTKFTNADGLHVEPFTDVAGTPQVTTLTAVAGGAANQVFVGYYGYETPNVRGDPLPLQKLGNADRIELDPATGTLSVHRYEFRCDSGTSWCWENRSVRRMLYGRSGAATGHLFLGMNHGVTHVFNDRFGDHIHVQVFYNYPDGTRTLKTGEQYALALNPDGTLWTGSRYGVGMQNWDADPKAWVKAKFQHAFTIYSETHDLEVASGYREEQRGCGVGPDGTVWFASLAHGLASFHPATAHHNYHSVKTWTATPGLPASGLIDLAADPDGTLWLVTSSGQLLRFDPASGTVTGWSGVSGVRRISLDTTVTPRALYVSTGRGLAVIRAR